jgi:SLT domain-containing protein
MAYKRSETFRNIVDGAFNWIKNAAGNLLDFFKKIPEFFVKAAKTLANVITTPYRLAFAAIAKLWNNTVGKLDFTIPDWVPGIGGKRFTAPKLPEGIPALAKGGIVNKPTLALIGEAGPEAVVPLTGKNAPGGQVINITVNGAIDAEGTARQIANVLRQSASTAGNYANLGRSPYSLAGI